LTRRALLPAVLVAAALATAGDVGPLEDDFGELRSLKDQADLAAEREGAAPAASLARAYATLRARVAAGLASARAPGDPADARAIAMMKRALDGDLPATLSTPEAAAKGAPACDADVAPIVNGPEAWTHLRAHLYSCFGTAARGLRIGDAPTDRLTILGRLGTTADPAERRRLFLALEPLWRSVNGDNGPRSPYRQLVRLLGARVREGRSPVASELDALGVPADRVEAWLVAMLEAWRAAHPTEIEPWDYWRLGHEAAQTLDGRIPRAGLERLNAEYYRALGADVSALRLRYDLLPRPGKTPVAYTTFGSRERAPRGLWRAGPVWIFATYRQGGIGNLVELLHETGHGIHIAAIRGRSPFVDWPDSTTFTEAIADVPALEAYEPEWQQRYLEVSATPADALRAKYAPVMLDVAWGLFEMRLAKDPDADPNAVWTGITERYLGIRPHPEWSWWAVRGQLVDEPGYMLNYAIGAVVAADVRARCRELRGPFTKTDPGYYDWLSARLYRFGLERPTRDVLAEFLGRPLAPDAVLADLGRLRDPR
jgi:hypothetical protein